MSGKVCIKIMTFGDRLKQRRDALKLRQEDIAQETGISRASIQRFESGDMPKGDYLIKLAEALQCSVDWLLTGKPESRGDAIHDGSTTLRPQQEAVDQNHDYDWQPGGLGDLTLPEPELPEWTRPDNLDDFAMIPLAEQFLSAGGGAYILSEAHGIPHAFRRQWLHKKTNDVSNLILLQVRGDSMEPTLRHNDTVMVDRSRRSLVSGHIYAVGLEDSILVKRIFRLPNDRIKLRSDNPEHAPLNAAIKDVRIIGEVIWLAREIA